MTPQTPLRSSTLSRASRALRISVAAAAIAALAFGAVGFGVVSHADAAAPARNVAAATPRLLDQGAPFSFADLVEQVSPAVVTVVVERESARADGNPLDDIPAPFRDFFRQFGQGQQGQGQGQGQQGQGQGPNRNRAPQTFRSEAMGSGFIIDSMGYIVTNNHVVDGGKKISVKLPNGREFEAHLIGTDKDTDVALIKVDGASDLPTVAFGDDRRLRVGDWVVAVGNPFGLGGTVTAGIVSSIGRDIGNGPYTDYIQIDAPINQGNSGGPTFDLSGRVVGMNTAIFSPSGGSVGIGFAIPASVVKAMVDQIKDHGKVTRGWLGVQIQNLTPDMAASLGTASAKGAIVANVIDNSPAAKAGFMQGDVILTLNGSEIDDNRDLTRKVASLVVGDRANFTVLRDGARRTLTAVIDPRDETQLASAERPAPDARQGRNQGNRDTAVSTALGMGMQQLNAMTREQFSIDDNVTGMVVSTVDPNSEAADKGFRPGDVIASIGNKTVRTAADIDQGIADARKAGRDSVLLLVTGRQGQGQRYVALKIGRS
jgi:serine protease Do